jgi:hypothetical protein
MIMFNLRGSRPTYASSADVVMLSERGAKVRVIRRAAPANLGETARQAHKRLGDRLAALQAADKLRLQMRLSAAHIASGRGKK